MLQQVFEADDSWLFEAVLKNCNARLVKNCDLRKASKMGFKMYIFVKKFVQNGKTYYYLVIEHYNPQTKRKKVLFQVSLKRILEAFKSELNCESETLGFGWCGGWGSNPRRPTPTGLKPVPTIVGSNPPTIGFLKQTLGIVFSQKLLKQFLEWCKNNASEETCNYYARRLEEIDNGSKEIGSSRWHITAYKKLARYLCERGNRKACEEYKRVKSRKSNPDNYIPPD
ncbi:MAG: hypothetical protein F7B59_08365, partial [Desulfurococcales archaeon]|nr:hypothetical protein [Desulfurococcales archaeon]